MNMHVSRRDILQGSGALIVSFSLAGAPDRAGAQAAAAKPVALTEVDSFVAVDAHGLVTVYSGKVDLGTGVATALPQIVAEELDVPLSMIRLVQGDTTLTPDQGPTWGSLSIQIGGVQLRNAAATARAALLEEAARRLGVRKEDLKVADGVVTAASKRVSYGELIGNKTFALNLDHAKPAPVKDPKDYKIVGKPVPRVDIPDKVTGAFTFMQDFRAPGMLHGRVIRPPAFGARLEGVDEASIKDVAGVVKIVRQGNFLGVVAESEWGAVKGARKLKTSWSKSQTLPDAAMLWEHVRASKIIKEETTSNVGDTEAALGRDGVKTLKATYDFAIHTHGSIGPSCAVAEFRDGKLTSWSASQATHNLRKQLATMFGMPVENVRCLYVEGSGCYGRNGHEDAAADAALLAKAVERPVRVQWSRADEHGWDPKGPPTLIDLRATLDASGAVMAWDSEFFIPQQTPNQFVVPLVAATLSGKPVDETIAPGNIFQNSNVPYKFANIKAVCHRLETTPFRPSWIRTPGRLQNTFANECFMDELAAAAGADPIEFRLKYLDSADMRGVEILNRVAALAQWEKRPSPRGGQSGDMVTGRGVSYCKYELVRTYIAVVAEVEVKRSTGDIRAKKFFVLHDCGQIINPDGVQSQIEGNIIQTVSRTLKEELTFSRSAVTSLDWASYPILRFSGVPDAVEVHIINRPGQPFLGSGEAGQGPAAAAVANAIADATGKRFRDLPITRERIKAAIGV